MTTPTPPVPPARVRTVLVGRPQTYQWLRRELVSSIFKDPVLGPVAVGVDGLSGDEQSDRKSHGGPDKAVYAYAREDEDWWEAETGRPFPDGSFGENLTTAGLDLTNAVIGETWRVGTALLQVTEPRTPCWKLGLKMDDPAFPRRAAASRRPGVLLRVLEEGVVAAGDAVVRGPAPAHGITAADVNRVYYGDSQDLAPIWDAPELAAHWRTWADHRSVWHLEDAKLGRLGPDPGL